MPRLVSPIPRENIVSKRIKELVERVPGASWLMPDPYDPSSYIMPVGGLTKLQGAKKLIQPFIEDISNPLGGSQFRQKLLTTLRKWLARPEESTMPNLLENLAKQREQTIGWLEKMKTIERKSLADISKKGQKKTFQYTYDIGEKKK